MSPNSPGSEPTGSTRALAYLATIGSSVITSTSYAPAERHILFELVVSEARCNGYGDVDLPTTRKGSVDL